MKSLFLLFNHVCIFFFNDTSIRSLSVCLLIIYLFLYRPVLLPIEDLSRTVLCFLIFCYYYHSISPCYMNPTIYMILQILLCRPEPYSCKISDNHSRGRDVGIDVCLRFFHCKILNLVSQLLEGVCLFLWCKYNSNKFLITLIYSFHALSINVMPVLNSNILISFFSAHLHVVFISDPVSKGVRHAGL